MPISLAAGLTMPSDFPTDDFEALHNKVASRGTQEQGMLFIGALYAIVYRFVSLAECDESFTASINAHGTSPGQPVRYQQDRDLFSFFSNGFSVFDAYSFALFVIGAITTPQEFPLATDEDERKITWEETRRRFIRVFQGDSILTVFDAITNDPAFKELRDIRHILTHRAVPSRIFTINAPDTTTLTRINIPLDAQTTSSRRHEMARLLRSALDAANRFVDVR